MTQKVEQGNYVEVHYTGSFDDGTVFDSSEGREALGVLAGEGMLIKGFDKALIGMQVGEEKEITISSADAYGERNDQLLRTVKLSEIGGDMTPEVGMMIGVQAPTGQTFPAVITKVEDETIEIDANHPLAGKTLHFKLKLELVREPTKEDMEKFMPQESSCGSCSSDCSTCDHDHDDLDEDFDDADLDEDSEDADEDTLSEHLE
jgi:peptidylprolyl isomerase